jgi:glycosyltransferase involved in cell wall biosynthesis
MPVEQSPLLTIAIPTYNRSQALAKLIDSIIGQLSGLPYPVEVLVADNGSGDETPQVMARYAGNTAIVSHRQPENLGFEQNYFWLLKASTGQFVWMVGDDDAIAEGFIGKLCQIISSTKADLYWVATRFADWDENDNDAGRYGFKAATFGPVRAFVDQCGLFGFLGGLCHAVFRRALATNIEPKHATSWPQVFVLAKNYYDRDCLLIPDTGIIVPVRTQDDERLYTERWNAEGLWERGMFNCMYELLDLVDAGIVPEHPARGFFRMMFHDKHPIHWHIYFAAAKKFIQNNEFLSPETWIQLERLNAMLNDPNYSYMLKSIYTSYVTRKALAESCYALVGLPRPFEFP